MHVAIIGAIGIGKSRLTEALADHLGYRAFYEPVKDNPYLDDFYADMKRFACIMQFFMLTQRFRQHIQIQKLRERNVGCVQDQIIFGDVLYAQLTHDLGFMDDRDFANYRDHFETLRPLLTLPDVVVLLETSVENSLARIRARGRPAEQAIDATYLSALLKLFRAWAESVQNQTKVLFLDWSAFQPVEEVVRAIEAKLNVQLMLPTVQKEKRSPHFRREKG